MLLHLIIQLLQAEASSNLARFDNIRYGFELNPDDYEWNTYFSKTRGNFGDEVKRRIIVGSLYYLQDITENIILKHKE